VIIVLEGRLTAKVHLPEVPLGLEIVRIGTRRKNVSNAGSFLKMR
jgi:hypothetical protein